VCGRGGKTAGVHGDMVTVWEGGVCEQRMVPGPLTQSL
jgi:hypothetical protein